MVRMTPWLAAWRAEQAARTKAELDAKHSGRMMHDFLVSEEGRQMRKSLVDCLLDCIQRHGARIWTYRQYRSLICACPDAWRLCTGDELASGSDNT